MSNNPLRLVAGFMIAAALCLMPGCKGGGCSSAYEEAKERAVEGIARGEVGPPKPTADDARKRGEVSEAGEGSPSSPAPTQREKAREKIDSAANAMGWIAGICAVVSLLTLIASFVVPILSRKLSAACLAAACLGWATQYALLVYGVLFAEIAVWGAVAVTVAVGVTTGLPLVLAWRNRTLAKLSDELASDHPDAAVALKATAMPRVLPDREARRRLLDQLLDDKAALGTVT